MSLARTIALTLAVAALTLLQACVSTTPTQSTGVSASSGPGEESEARKRARIRLELATGYFEEDKANIALEELRQAITTDPNFADPHNLAGLVYMRLNDLRLAEESFRRALQLDPRNASTLHNYGWLLCQQARFAESYRQFEQALADPTYNQRAKTFLTLGLCQARAGARVEAERSLLRSYELDPGNPITGYNLSALMFRRGEATRAQFYIRRLNNGEYANAESLWLGIKIERQLGERVAAEQLANQLRRRYPQSREYGAYERGAFDE